MNQNNHAIVPLFGEGNFLGVELKETLDSQKRYFVEFHVSLADSSRFAGRNIGVHFSQGIPVDISWSASVKTNHLLSLTPQVRYEGEFLTDKEGWTRIAGSFIAEGGENYMTIGNFDGYYNSDTLNLHEGGVEPDIGFWELALYFIDDVSVVEDTSYHVGINEVYENDFNVNLYPNPNTGEFNIRVKMKETDHAEMTVWSSTGQMVHASNLVVGHNTVRLNVAQGLYLYRITVNEKTKWTGKVAISRY